MKLSEACGPKLAKAGLVLGCGRRHHHEEGGKGGVITGSGHGGDSGCQAEGEAGEVGAGS